MGVRSPGTEVTDSCELPCGCWELNSGPLEEQSVCFSPEPSLRILIAAIGTPLALVSRLSNCASQAGFELEIVLPQHSKCSNYSHASLHLAHTSLEEHIS